MVDHLPLPSPSRFSPLRKLPIIDRKPVRLKVSNRLTVSPNYSLHFGRSPFFFLNRLVLRTKLTDLLSSVKSLRSKAKYLVFPDANDLKTSVFRRLNRQKNVFHARFLSASAARLSLSPNSMVKGQYIPGLTSTPTVANGVDAAQFAAVARRSAKLTSFLSDHKVGGYKVPRIRRIRFKPGYGRI